MKYTELTHDIALSFLQYTQQSVLKRVYSYPRVCDPIKIFNIVFPNRIGLSAGMDKNGRCIDAFASMGFGFVEVGTVTPLAQKGNTKPRLFRLQNGIINRMGFNNDGVDKLVYNVKTSHTFREKTIPIGINIGKNSNTPIDKAIDDYVKCLETVYPYADYIAINVSSPNTVGLRSLQEESMLNKLVDTIEENKFFLCKKYMHNVPIFLKISPDITSQQMKDISKTILRMPSYWGLIATNTTTDHTQIEKGGLSGEPLLEKSNRVISEMRSLVGSKIPIIGTGGVMTEYDALSKKEAGADLVQLYTGLVFSGVRLVESSAKYIR